MKHLLSRISHLASRNANRGWVLIVSIAMLFGAPIAASAATAGFSGPAQVQVGRMFTVNMNVSGAKDADTARFIGTFPSDLIQLQNMANVGSFPNRSPGSSQSAGSFNFGVFSLGDSVNGSARAGTLTFKALKVGTAVIKLTGGTRILSAGVDQLTGAGSITIQITEAPAPGEIPKAEEKDIILESGSHPDQNKWYSSREVDVNWKVIGRKPTAIYIGFDQAPEGPAEEQRDNDSQTHFTAAKDGVWYAHLVARYSASEVVRRDFRVQIDSTPPRAFAVVTDYTDVISDIPNVLRFAALDDTSGIVQYDVYLNDEFLSSTTDTALPLGNLQPGEYQVRVRATDRAGNAAEARSSFTILSPVGKAPAVSTESSRDMMTRWAGILFLSLLLFVLGFLLGRTLLASKKAKPRRKGEK